MTTRINRRITEITFKVSSEIFSFNAMIETCRSFLFNLGYTEISSMYIVLRELIFNTIINVANNNDACVFECTIQLVSKGRFKVSMVQVEGCTKDGCFGWIAGHNEDAHMDRGNTLIHGNTDSIDIDIEDNNITVYVSLTPEREE